MLARALQSQALQFSQTTPSTPISPPQCPTPFNTNPLIFMSPHLPTIPSVLTPPSLPQPPSPLSLPKIPQDPPSQCSLIPSSPSSRPSSAHLSHHTPPITPPRNLSCIVLPHPPPSNSLQSRDSCASSAISRRIALSILRSSLSSSNFTFSDPASTSSSSDRHSPVSSFQSLSTLSNPILHLSSFM
uniref:Uncharacterized protein n=1 Tax=Knipowitschia caucasica TaxID=637954 RepID=A0AAV2M8K0_KNICA